MQRPLDPGKGKGTVIVIMMLLIFYARVSYFFYQPQPSKILVLVRSNLWDNVALKRAYEIFIFGFNL